MKVALVGCGVVAEKKHLPALSGLPEIQVSVLVDPDAERAAVLKSFLPHANIESSLENALQSGRFEAVAITSPPATHIALALEALEAGKFVLVEKPLCLDLQEASRLERHPRRDKVLMGFHMRFHRQVEMAKALLDSGRLGEIQGFRCSWCAPRPENQAGWKNLRAEGGGSLIELAVHFYDLARHLLDSDLIDLKAYSTSADRPDETACVLGRTQNGIPFSGTFSERGSHQLEFEVYGERGRLRVDCLRFDGFEFSKWGEDPGAVSYRAKRFLQTLASIPEGLIRSREGGDYMLSYREQWRHFLQVVRGEEPPICPVADGVASLGAVLQTLAAR